MPSSVGTLERRPAATPDAQATVGLTPLRRRAAPSRRERLSLGEWLARDAPSQPSTASEADGQPGFAAAPPRLRTHLPLSLLLTASVLIVPALIVSIALRPAGLPAKLGCALLAAVLSIAIARAEALAWQRRRTTDLLYGELMLWGLARRWWLERRLEQIGLSYASAAADGVGRVELLEGLNRLLEARNAYTHRHCHRVAHYSEQIARAMHLSDVEVARVRSAALVHDVGKVYTPLTILQKPGPLTEEEFAIVKRHARDGGDMLGPVHDPQLASIVRHHHERIDGSGYPDGLSGDEIPLGARIVAVADTFDAITSRRPYRPARSHREALNLISAEAGRQLDGDAVAAFRTTCAGRRSLASAALLTAVLDRAAGSLLPFGFGSSAAQLLPALGAAGVLALAPSSRAEKAPQQGSGPAALYSALGAALGGPAASTLGAAGETTHGGSGGGTGVAPRAGVRTPRHSTGGRPGSRPALTSTGTGSSGPSTPAGTSEAQSPLESIKSKVPRVPPAGGEGPLEKPPVTSTPEPAPPVSTPTATVPSVTTPTVETPAGRVPAVTTPAVEVPAVHLPPIQAPPTSLPHLP